MRIDSRFLVHALSRVNRAPRGASRALRTRLALAAGAAAIALAPAAAAAQEKLVFLTSWYAQAEHGGFYQALASGLYKKAGLDVTIRMGGPQVNGMQLLAAGQADVIMGYDIQTMKAWEQGIPAVTIATSFQKDLQGMMTHDDVTSLAGLKDHTILVATSGHSSWWPWLKAKYGYTDGQSRPYTFNIQPFLADRKLAQQGYPSSEPFAAAGAGAKVNFFLFADDGYPPYGTTMVTLEKQIKERPAVMQKFVQASLEGWKAFFADPAAAVALIKKDNPNMKDEQIAFAIQRMKALQVLDGGDAKTAGIGTIRPERFKQTYDMLVGSKLLDASKVDVTKTYTTQFVRDLKILP
ncbi:MAG: ABC transporter substrate-binding protein [Burkholderiales bacterium]|nr:MAG: ABC transporter substrate-binding protein [Burkholderiales bacterium]